MRIFAATILIVFASVLGHVRADGPSAGAAYETAVRHYERGELEDALAAFQYAYSLDHAANLLFNIAQCQRKLGRDEDAIANYEAYLEAAPDADNRAEVAQRVAALRAQRPEPAREQPRVQDPILPLPAAELGPAVRDDERSVSALVVLGSVTGAVAVGSLVASAVLAANAEAAAKTAGRKPMFSPQDEQSVHAQATAHYVTLGIGLAASAAAATLFAFALWGGRERDTAIAPIVTQQTVSLYARGRF